MKDKIFIVYNEKEFDHCINKLEKLNFYKSTANQMNGLFRTFNSSAEATSIYIDKYNTIDYCSDCLLCEFVTNCSIVKNKTIIKYKFFFREDKLKRILF